MQKETSMSGSVGGWITHSMFKNKHIFTEITSGFSWEPLNTKAKNPNPKNENDSLFSVSSWGFSLGINTWFNTFGNHNIGLKIMYHFAAYDRDRLLKSELGGHLYSVSLVYRFLRRKDIFREYYIR